MKRIVKADVPAMIASAIIVVIFLVARDYVGQHAMNRMPDRSRTSDKPAANGTHAD